MAVIKSGSSTDQWSIDPVSKAGRVTLYDASGNPMPTLPISAAALPLPAGASTEATLQSILTNTPPLVAGSVPITGAISLGVATGKTAVMKTGQATTAAATQATVLTYTVTNGKTFYLEYFDLQGRLTTLSTTASILGTVIVQINGVTVYTASFVNPSTGDSGSQDKRLPLVEPIPIGSAVVISVLVTPASTTSMLWTANFGGYEK